MCANWVEAILKEERIDWSLLVGINDAVGTRRGRRLFFWSAGYGLWLMVILCFSNSG